jgi:hypothetical protein
MHPIIQQALKHLEGANYAGFFEEMDKIVPANMQNLYNEHKGKFMAGKQEWNFHQQLEVFAKEVGKTLSNTSTSSNDVSKDKTVIQQAEKIYNIGNIDQANFS